MGKCTGPVTVLISTSLARLAYKPARRKIIDERLRRWVSKMYLCVRIRTNTIIIFFARALITKNLVLISDTRSHGGEHFVPHENKNHNPHYDPP